MTERLSDAELARADELAANATPGPWKADGTELSQHWSRPEPWLPVATNEVACMAYCYGGSARGIEHEDDAEFIAFARTALPALVAEVRVLRGQVAEALRIEAWPYKPATMTGFELDQADGYNDARREFRRALGVVSDD